jgi:hypothetical protein
MTAFAIYDETTGEILRTGDVPDALIDLQAGAGERVYRGRVDAQRSRIDTDTREPVEYIPPQPEVGATWDAQRWQWVTRANRNEPIISRIAALESRQARAVREAVLTGNKAALQQIEAQIEVLRNTLERD